MDENNELIERIAKRVDQHLRDVIEANGLIWSRPGGPSNLALNIARAVLDETRKAAD